MHINSDRISLQNRIFRGTSSIGGIHLPNFKDNYIFTKQKSGISDKVYRKKIVEQAYKDSHDGKFQNESEEYNVLMKKYVSEVSPDRKGIIIAGLEEAAKNKEKNKGPIDYVALILEGELRYQKSLTDDSEYIEFFDKNGELVATYTDKGWTMNHTKKEAARQMEMSMIYNRAWGNAKKGIPLETGETVNSEMVENSFDVKA